MSSASAGWISFVQSCDNEYIMVFCITFHLLEYCFKLVFFWITEIWASPEVLHLSDGVPLACLSLALELGRGDRGLKRQKSYPSGLHTKGKEIDSYQFQCRKEQYKTR